MVTSEEFASWKASTVTKFFLKYLQDLREELKEELATGQLTKDRADSTAMKCAEYIGMCSVILSILNIDHADISEFNKVDSEKENDGEDRKPIGDNPA